MNALALTCLLCFVCSALGTSSSEITSPGGLSHGTGGPTSVEGLQNSLREDDELGGDEELSGGAEPSSTAHDQHLIRDERRGRKGRGKHRRNNHRSKSTTALDPAHSGGGGSTSPASSTEDPCVSTHKGYCIHGFCKYMEGLREPVCVCLTGYDGERCGIHTLEITHSRGDGEESWAEVVQTVLVVMAVVLSVLSFAAILLMACAHYRTHKTFMASYLGTGAEEEKLQKPIRDVMV